MTEPKKEPFLRFPRTGAAECTECGQKFFGKTKDEVLAQFCDHKCYEDFNQTPARMVREATKD